MQRQSQPGCRARGQGLQATLCILMTYPAQGNFCSTACCQTLRIRCMRIGAFTDTRIAQFKDAGMARFTEQHLYTLPAPCSAGEDFGFWTMHSRRKRLGLAERAATLQRRFARVPLGDTSKGPLCSRCSQYRCRLN